VAGDFLVLEAGDVAAADARLRTAHALTVLRGWPLLQVSMAAIDLDVPGRQSTLEQKVTRRRQLRNPAPPCPWSAAASRNNSH